MTSNRICLIMTVLMICLGAACNEDASDDAQGEAPVVIVTVNESEQYVDIRNESDVSQNVAGWYLSLGRQTTCYLEDDAHLQPGETLRVWALAKDAGEDGYNCGLDRPFWSRKEPKRTFLCNADGEVVDKYFAGEG